jgi:hypothetical protein
MVLKLQEKQLACISYLHLRVVVVCVSLLVLQLPLCSFWLSTWIQSVRRASIHFRILSFYLN